ncbi:iron-sulfur cluster biosynthesis family protein [Lacticaseibacillus jixianensis]|uniref:Iron-sulfur cluster biosynthesis family protein n=1 Tax=Lacticaseibacillus jixianensis TaxID=2486012 RepID=A0ABW4B865_9LACO|nr:iron-sulfur cluster biosynthesis family protein [Lacticaseibacillus jixianensis]
MELTFDDAAKAKIQPHLGPDKKLLLTFEDGVGQYSQHAMIHMMIQFTLNVVAKDAKADGYNVTVDSNLGPLLIKDYSAEDLDEHLTVHLNETLNTMQLSGDGGVIDSDMGFLDFTEKK